MRIYRDFRSVLSENWRTYLLLNVVVYGTLIATMIVTPLIPGMYETGLANMEAFLDAPGASLVLDAYAGGDIVRITLLTFLANLLFAALLTTTLPSLVIPFFGVVATVWRAVFIGMPYAPTSAEEGIVVLATSPVLVIEFQAYVLAMLGSVLLWRSTFGHRRRELPSAWAGYRAGVRDNLRLYPAIVVLLLGIALVEGITYNMLY
ncbi:hypothetical protein [Nocardiopsis sp. MG754419]|uniref:hypothetical protein n=1 Tax=Nocardiopsis sp. MG754419 TaxID=2259865 RepID=UPI001BAA5D88|nr:hypothetical protein [Nocardiopsis sp. MG754419]MBR8742719.1 hypothetical protein [Nocardiopsis sp. MG754419]